MKQSRDACRDLVGTPKGKIPLERPRHRLEDNIKVDLREVTCDTRNWMNLAKIGTNSGLA